MVSLTLSVTEDFKKDLKSLSWVNWSEIAREEVTKKLIFEKYIKRGILSDDEDKFCESIDWHPADELPLKEEFVRKISALRREKSIKIKSISSLFK